MEYFYITDPGKVREQNEDSVIIVKNQSNQFLAIVADGMGGHCGGEIASTIAATIISKSFKNLDKLNGKEEAMYWLKEIASEANNAIYEQTIKSKENEGMGTTLVCAILTDEYLIFGNIGDSSGYVIKNNKLHKITFDHTLVNLLVKSGEITKEEAKDHPRKNVLMRALGSSISVEMDIFDVETNVEGIFLCSDGLTNMLTEEQIVKVLNDELSVEEQLKKLIYKCNNRGGTDNISIAYIKKVGAHDDK